MLITALAPAFLAASCSDTKADCAAQSQDFSSLLPKALVLRLVTTLACSTLPAGGLVAGQVELHAAVQFAGVGGVLDRFLERLHDRAVGRVGGGCAGKGQGQEAARDFRLGDIG